jgi:hypothetical protein
MPRPWPVFVLIVAGAIATPRADQLPSRREVVERAGAWAERFGTDLRGVVARERYVQTVRPWMGTPPELPSEVPAIETRRLVSSLLLVHDPATPWQLHRDVLAVDDVPVADRRDRLAQLFAARDMDPRQRLRQITDDSARYNLGHVTRNVNVPTFPLLVVHAAYRDRFRFRDRGRMREDDADVRLIAYEEKGRPRVVRGDRHRDVVLEGVLVIEESSGALVRATVKPRAGDLRSRLEVWFGRVPGLPLRVPVRFWEWYWVHDVPERDRYIEGEATYDDFRRYTTDVGPLLP